MDLVKPMEAIYICSESSLHPNLPPEIINEILLRLPVRSLLKFKCVCKSWLLSISSSQFIKSHLDITRKSTSYSKYTLISASYESAATLYTCPLSSIFSNTVMDNSRPFHFPMSVSDDQLRFVGSCNGLLCVYVDQVILVLYNPSIRKFKTLPASGTETRTTFNISYGFCYDGISDDFKVVELNIMCNQASMYHIEVKVFSLRNYSWRKIENGHDGHLIYGCGGKSIGGILHWLIYSYADDRAYLIFAVNTATNMHDTLEPPKSDGKCGIPKWSLGELNGCLGVICDYGKSQLDVWTMKEYGVKESWSKVFSICCPINPSGRLWLLFVLEITEFFLAYGTYTMLYNSRSNSFTVHQIHNIGGFCSVAAPPYIESLVDPNFLGE